MAHVLQCVLAAFVALVTDVSFADTKTISVPIIAGGTITEPSKKAIAFLSERAASVESAPLEFRYKTLPPADFCASLRNREKSLHVSLLSTYRRCYQEQRALAAFDFPFLATDWVEAKRLLDGPIGSAIAAGLNEHGVQLLSFWVGDSRVLSSRTLVKSANDLKGSKVAAPSTFASQTVIAQSGGTSMSLPAADVAAALDRGLVDTADTSLGFFSQALADVHKSALLSNHSLDPFVVAMPLDALRSLTSEQRGFLETLLRQTSAVQALEAEKTFTRTLEMLKERGVEVVPLSESAAASFRTPFTTKVSMDRATEVFAASSPATRAASLSQIQRQPVASYLTVHFATNRAMTNGVFDNTTAQNLLYGKAKVELKYEARSGGSTGPPPPHLQNLLTHEKPGKGIVIDPTTVSSTPFPAGFARTPQSIPAQAPLIYIHGFANTLDDALNRGAWISWNVQRAVVVFAWPSLGQGTPGAYRTDQQTAIRSYDALATLLMQLGVEHEGATDVDLVVHSMGAFVLLGALEELEKKSISGKSVKFRQLVFVAPDVAARKVQQIRASLTKYFEKYATLYVSDHDRALGISRRFMNAQEGPRAGLAPPVLVTDRVESIFIGPNDFSFTGHSYHVANGVIADDIVELLRYGVGAPYRRGSLLSPTGQRYYELRRLKDL